MKKFLTVLLVIAVMFTFSFGSAFATPAQSEQVAESKVTSDVLTAVNYAKAQEKAAMDAAINALFGTATTKTFAGTEVSKAAVTSAFNDVYEEKLAVYDTAYAAKLSAIQAAIIADNATGDAFSGFFTTGAAEDGYPAIDATWTQFDAATNYTDLFKLDGTGTKAKEVYKAEFDALKADTIKVIEAIDLTAYSVDAKGATESNYDKAKRLVTQALNQLAILKATDDAAGYKAAIDTIYKIYTPAVNQADPTGDLYAGTATSGTNYAPGLSNIQKSSAEPTEAAKLQWAQNKVLGELTTAINNAKNAYVAKQNDTIIEEGLKTKPVQKTIDTAKENIEKAEAQYAAALEIVTYLVKDCDNYNDLVNVASKFTESTTKDTWAFTAGADTVLTDDTLKVPAKEYVGSNYPTYASNGATYSLATCEAITKKVDALEADAELAKKSIELDGTTYAEIDKALEKAVKEAYYGNSAAAVQKSSEAGILADRKAELIGKLDTDTVKVNNKTYDAVVAWDKNLEATYNKDKFDAVRKVMSDAKTAIKAAKTTADADAAFLAGVEALKAVPTKTDKSLAQAKKDFADLLTKYKKDIDAYADYKAASYPSKTYAYNATTFKNNLKAELEKAYTVDELTAIYNADVAKVDGLQTEAQLKEAKAAIEKQIAAIPTNVTVADKDAVKAARKALDDHNEYCDFIGNTVQKVTLTTALINAETAIKNAEIKAIQDAYNAIMKDGKVTADEKPAVEDLRKAFDAFCAEYTPENAAPADVVTAAGTVTEANMDALEAALYADQAKAVKDMIAVLDVVNVDAAAVKAARAAYDALDEDYQFGGTYYDKLVALEKILSVDVQALKITASSTAKKGSITVKWTVKGNVTAADGFQVWKSTKKNSGFKKAITTTKKSYKNTKGLKKGTRYYYKVRAYKVVDGKKVYSDWSNKAYRVAK